MVHRNSRQCMISHRCVWKGVSAPGCPSALCTRNSCPREFACTPNIVGRQCAGRCIAITAALTAAVCRPLLKLGRAFGLPIVAQKELSHSEWADSDGGQIDLPPCSCRPLAPVSQIRPARRCISRSDRGGGMQRGLKDGALYNLSQCEQQQRSPATGQCEARSSCCW